MITLLAPTLRPGYDFAPTTAYLRLSVWFPLAYHECGLASARATHEGSQGTRLSADALALVLALPNVPQPVRPPHHECGLASTRATHEGSQGARLCKASDAIQQGQLLRLVATLDIPRVGDNVPGEWSSRAGRRTDRNLDVTVGGASSSIPFTQITVVWRDLR